MVVDKERVLSKISYISEQVVNIRSLVSEKSREEIISDPWLLKGLKYALQTSIESMIDLAYHIAVKQFKHAPAEARDALKVLSEKGLIPRKDLPVYSAMIGFRNRVVHGYQEVSPERVYALASRELGDFEKFIRQVSVLLKQ